MYRATLSLGELFGLPIRVHVATLAAVALLLALADGMAEAYERLLMVLAVLGAMIVHELGHALMARRVGHRPVGLVLTPLGGATAILPPAGEAPASSPRAAIAIALAGPLTGLVAAGVLWPIGWFLGVPTLRDLAAPHLFFALLHLLPASPLDGGRALHALLLPRLGLLRATRLTMWVSRAVAVIGGAVCLWLEAPHLAVVAALLFASAALEGRRRLVLGVIGPRSIFEAMQRVGTCATPFMTLEEAQAMLDAAPAAPALPVCYGDRVVGVVHRLHLLVATLGEVSMALGDLMDRDVVTHDGDGPLIPLLLRMRAAKSRAAVIRDGGAVIGVLTLEQVADDLREAIKPPARG